MIPNNNTSAPAADEAKAPAAEVPSWLGASAAALAEAIVAAGHDLNDPTVDAVLRAEDDAAALATLGMPDADLVAAIDAALAKLGVERLAADEPTK